VGNGTLAAPVEATYRLADYRQAIGYAAAVSFPNTSANRPMTCFIDTGILPRDRVMLATGGLA
jgi:hypothetical protein